MKKKTFSSALIGMSMSVTYVLVYQKTALIPQKYNLNPFGALSHRGSSYLTSPWMKVITLTGSVNQKYGLIMNTCFSLLSDSDFKGCLISYPI